MIRLLTSLLFSCLFFWCSAQSLDAPRYDNDPAVLVEAFARGRVKQDSSVFAGEALANPIQRSKLPKAPSIKAILHWRDSLRALVALEYANERSAEDLYAFVDSLPQGWRIVAFRAFDLPSVYYQQLNHYRNQGEASIRRNYVEKWERSKSKGVSKAAHEAVHGTEENRVFYVFNLRLAASADRDLIRHHEFLRKQFNQLRESLTTRERSPIPIEHDDDAVGDDLRYLLVKRAYHGEGAMRFELASIEGKDVGYLYCADASCMPTPTPGGVIALREIGDGWYVYRRI